MSSEVEQHDRMWGAGNWIVHERCPDAAIAGQDRAIHHKEYHRVVDVLFRDFDAPKSVTVGPLTSGHD